MNPARRPSSGPPPEMALPLPVLDAASGLWSNVGQRPSPHCDERPEGEAISLLVVHHISLPPGEFGGPWIDQLFMGTLDCTAHPYFERLRGLRVSAHACVFRDGHVRQYVPTTRRAWHAGASHFDGRERCNDFSIGIELEGDEHQPYTDAQYTALARLVVAALRAYPALTPERIVGHSDIAPGRKLDPGPCFDWPRLLALVEFPR
ncbi:MAG: 1,6-anhydro-N-acetylmuramyl-L-alanine amidase AmpD [Stagnimonas sp.]|nr:1,6-anhydro-N-acetylmuramyl-L-alanine amidase AmpD [Stagnimonas sp.]